MSDQSTLFEDLALKYSSLTDDENLVKFFLIGVGNEGSAR